MDVKSGCHNTCAHTSITDATALIHAYMHVYTCSEVLKTQVWGW